MEEKKEVKQIKMEGKPEFEFKVIDEVNKDEFEKKLTEMFNKEPEEGWNPWRVLENSFRVTNNGVLYLILSRYKLVAKEKKE